MSKILYGLAILFLIAWGIGFFIYSLNLFIHLLLFAAVVLVVINILKEDL
ncbi:lmo0937 family membrane protein [Algibacter pacificus]